VWVNMKASLWIGLDWIGLGQYVAILDWIGSRKSDPCPTLFDTTLRPIFYGLENFHRTFWNLLAPPTDGSAKRLVRCKVPLVS